MNVRPLQRYLWVLRILTVALAPLLAFAAHSAARQRGDAAGLVSTVAWAVLVAVVLATLVAPSPAGLTISRMLLPAAAVGAVLTLVYGASTAWGVLVAAVALLAALVAFTAETGEAFVQASAYGDERRLPLRAPAAVLLPMALSWLVWCAVAVAAVLLLAAGRWVFGFLALAAAAGAGVAIARRAHRFSRRWLVLVPAGVVVHDHVTLAETLMVSRANIARAALAPADTEAADLTGPAAGHALEIAVREMALVVRAATPASPKGTALHVQSFLVAPSRPGRALSALAAAKVPVG